MGTESLNTGETPVNEAVKPEQDNIFEISDPALDKLAADSGVNIVAQTFPDRPPEEQRRIALQISSAIVRIVGPLRNSLAQGQM